jgi:UDP-2,3-diacylglucosamine hydrolase
MELAHGKKIYFLSDFHLGAPNAIASREREQQLVQFLKQAKSDAAAIFIVGDIFDFWF